MAMEVTQQKLQEPLGCTFSAEATDSHCMLHLIATAEPLVSTERGLSFFFSIQ